MRRTNLRLIYRDLSSPIKPGRSLTGYFDDEYSLCKRIWIPELLLDLEILPADGVRQRNTLLSIAYHSTESTLILVSERMQVYVPSSTPPFGWILSWSGADMLLTSFTQSLLRIRRLKKRKQAQACISSA